MPISTTIDCSTGEVFEEEVELPPAPVPASVTRLQIRRALRQQGLIDEINALVAVQSDEVKEAWEYADQIQRDHEVIAAGAAQLGMTSEQVDDLFRLAATL